MQIDEQLRLDELRRYDIVDTEREPAFDRLVELAALACGTPIALITLIDEFRQWSKAEHGVSCGEMAREISLCARVVQLGRLLVVEDASGDARFAANPLVTGPESACFYAGAPLITPRGLALGTLCVVDRRPRRISAESERALVLLRDQVMLALENRRELIELRRAEGLRQEAVEALLATKIDLEKRIELRTREVEAARERLHRTLARVSDGFVALDREWRYTYVNEQAGRMIARPPADLLGKRIWSELPDELLQPLQSECERAMQHQLPLTVSTHWAASDRWFESRLYPSPEGLTIFVAEITQQRQAEDALRDTARRLQEAQAVAHVGSWEWSPAQNRVVWSDEMYRIYGITPEQFGGTYESFLSRVHSEDVAHTRLVVSDAYQNPKRFVYDHRIVRADGAVRMLHTVGRTLTDEQGRVLRMVGSCWDTTEQWLAVQGLERAAAVVQTLVDSASEGILVTDESWHVLAFNEQLVKMFALPASLITPQAEVAPLFAHVADQLTDRAAFAAHVDRARSNPHQALVESFRIARAGQINCGCRPYGNGSEPTGRIWTFAPR